MDLSIVIPIYNEEQNIKLLYNRLMTVAEDLHVAYEIIFVNDGSQDNSIDYIKALCIVNNHVKYIDFSRNFGHQIAVTAGMEFANGQAIVIIDADLQDPPELITKMYSKLQAGYQVVYAKRRIRKGESLMKRLTAHFFYRLLARITDIPIPLDAGDFRIMDRKVVEVLKGMPEQQKFLRGQVAWVGFNQAFVEYDRDERYGGKTGYSYRKMLCFALDGITSYSNLPLKFATASGFLVSGIAFLVMLYALYSRFILRDYVQGWTSIILSVLFLGGIQLVCFGIIGEYISRISSNIRNRPLYVINESNIKKNKPYLSYDSDTAKVHFKPDI